MKRIIYIISCLVVLSSFALKVNAKSLQDAQLFASNFFAATKSSDLLKVKAVSQTTLCYQSLATANNPTYIFNNSLWGFVVFVSTDNGFQVVGYGDTPITETIDNSNSVSKIIKLYENADKNKIVGIQNLQEVQPVVAPLLDAAGVNLNQFSHPEVGGCYTGCVATAMTQVAAFYKYPTHGTGSNCYNHSSYGQICADFANTTYNWINPTSNDYLKLSFHVGVAMNMNYCGEPKTHGSYPSSSDYLHTLQNYFGYYATIYPSENQYIFNELNQNRPIYSELYGDPGHAIVLDGYDSNGFLHINFGWGGAYNGYYLMNTNSTFNVGYKFGTNLALCVFVSKTTPKVAVGDSIALMSIYQNINGTGWDITKPVYQWSGVLVLNQRVVELTINKNSTTISGTIPESVGNLTMLRKLNLGGVFSGVLPSSISKLTNLEDIAINNLGGTLKCTLPSDISVWSKLKNIYFRNCLEGTIPTSISTCKNLANIDFTDNSISGTLPTSICHLGMLTTFSIANNKLTGTLPDSIGNWKNLTLFNINDNQFSGSIPISLGSMGQLKSLFLKNNLLTGQIPDSIRNCKQIQTIYLNNNKLEGAIPFIFDAMTNLSYLDLSNNRLTSLPENMGNMPLLYYLNIGNNQINNIPKSIYNLPKLKYFYANSNKISLLPDGIEILQSVTDMSLANNLLTDFPEGICQLMNLSSLNMSYNKLQKLPAGIADIAVSQDLYLQNNELSGFIPLKLMNKPFSTFLINDNKFTYNDLPKGKMFTNGLGYQKLLAVKSDTLKGILGDTLKANISDLCDNLNPYNHYTWCEYPEIVTYYQQTKVICEGPIFKIPLNNITMSKKYYCSISNDSVAQYMNMGYLKTSCLPSLTTDTLYLATMTADEILASKYPNNQILKSSSTKSGQVNDKLVTLISPWKMRGTKKWQASSDNKTWYDISSSMTQNDLKSNIANILPEELKLNPKTPAYYRAVVSEGSCNPLYSDTIKVNPYGKLLCDTTLNVSTLSKTLKVDSIEITIPKGITDKNFRLTVVKLSNPPAAPDSVKLGSVYDVTVSFGSIFDLPITIKLRNLKNKNISTLKRLNFKPVYFDESSQLWTEFSSKGVSVTDSFIIFQTQHLTKLSWYELGHGTYTNMFTRSPINVVYKWLPSEMGLYNVYDFKLKKSGLKPYHDANNNPDKGGNPYLVQDIAEFMIEIQTKLKSQGIAVPEYPFFIYIATNPSSATYGEISALGYLADYLCINLTQITNEEDLKTTLAHEYMHYIEDKYMIVLTNNMFWSEAYAPIAGRMVWDETELENPEPESTLSKSMLTGGGFKSIFDLLGASWDAATSLPVIEKLIAESADANLSSTFLHYMCNLRTGSKLDGAKLLTDHTWSSNVETWVWRSFLNEQVTKQLNKTAGDEYDDFVRYLFSGINENFTVLNQNQGNPLSYMIKNFGNEDNGTFARYINYKFEKMEVQENKMSFTVPYLASKALYLNNMDADKMTVIRYKRTEDLTSDEKVYVARYDQKTARFIFTDISDKKEYSILLKARTDNSSTDLTNACFLLMVNKRCPAMISYGNDFKANFELKAYPVVNIKDLMNAYVTINPIHSYSDGLKHSYYLEGLSNPNLSDRTYTLSGYYSNPQLLNDTVLQIYASFTQIQDIIPQIWTGSANVPKKIQKANTSLELSHVIQTETVNQNITFYILSGEMSISDNINTTNKYKYTDNENTANNYEYVGESYVSTKKMQLANITDWKTGTMLGTNEKILSFDSKTTVQTQSCIKKLEENTTDTYFNSSGGVTSTKNYWYISTDYSGLVTLSLNFHY